MKQRLCILGSTGSIGTSTLDVVGQHPERFEVVSLTANHNVDLLVDQCKRFSPQVVVVPDEKRARAVRAALAAAKLRIEVLERAEDLAAVAAADDVDMVMAAIVGAAGLPAALAAARTGKTILLANKEALVMSGPLFMRAVRDSGATLLPIDSEHNAIFQALPREYSQGLEQVGVRKIILTASGGPFRTWSVEQLAGVTPDAACAHPNWVMGRKISVDSATMMNKGLEVIEAHWLFNATPAQIDVLIHPQSIIHSMVEFLDGSVLAQLGNPDMRTPIACALAWPARIDAGVAPLDLAAVARLDFEAVSLERYPCLKLARAALERGDSAATLLNAANEIAVAAFLDGRIGFMQIPEIVAGVLDDVPVSVMGSLQAVHEADRRARASAERMLGVAA